MTKLKLTLRRVETRSRALDGIPAGRGLNPSDWGHLQLSSPTTMHRVDLSTRSRTVSSALQHRQAVLRIFCDPVPPECAMLQQLSRRQWQRLLHWMDISGLALYFLDRVTELQWDQSIPQQALSRLQQNLLDNTDRTAAMIRESTAIHRSFQKAGLSYATLKGFSLWPSSVPKLELRSQLDLDFLIAEKNSAAARRLLEKRGYHLHAISGRTWEFKSNEPCSYSLKDLYKVMPQRSVELHLESADAGSASLLDRTERLWFHGVFMPLLSPDDLFLGQGLHLYKHVCSEFSRTAHLLEFRRHIAKRYHDEAFRQKLRARAEGNPRSPAALGLVILLISKVMGEFAPKALTCWTVDRLPDAARLWVDLYGRRSVFGDPPGNKLYLLLEREMERAGVQAKRPLRHALLPMGLPQPIAHSAPNETLAMRVKRHGRQIRFIWSRLRFHTVEGIRYLRESARWGRRLSDLTC